MRALAFLIVIVLLSTTRIPLPRLYRQLWPSGIWPFCVRGHVRPEELMNSNNLEHAGTISIRRIRITDGFIEIVRDLKDLPLTGMWGSSLTLAPDDSPLLLRNIGTHDV